MKERPILFNAPMVRAILAGTKMQTRRVMRNQVCDGGIVQMAGPGYCEIVNKHGVSIPGFVCPYGQPGDQLWVRETWAAPHSEDARPPRAIQCDRMQIHYEASEDRGGLLWSPSTHMPRWASRITLEITGVRVERLHEISEADAMAEGVNNSLHLSGGRFARENFAHLWWTIYGDGAWEENPWVWVVEFKQVKGGAA